MKKINLLLILLLFRSVCVRSEALYAEREVAMDEVFVTAQKSELSAQAYRLVTTITHDQIATLPIATVTDILRYLPAVDVRCRGANGAQVDVSMRGGTFDQVLVLLNGVCLNDAQTGHYTMNIPISPLLIERVEVLQGSSVTLQGTNAFSGAINIVTRTPETPNDMSLQMGFGMNEYLNPAIAASFLRGETQYNASLELSRADGYRAPSPTPTEAEGIKNNDYLWANAYFQARWRTLDVQMGAQWKDAGAGLFYGGSTDQFDATRTAFVSARYNHRWDAWTLDIAGSYRANRDRYEWHRGQALYGNKHFSQNADITLRTRYASTIGTTTLGIELRDETINSTNLGDTGRLHLTYFAEQTLHWRNLNASVGVSGIYNSMFGQHVSGSANVGYEFRRGSALYANAQRVLRMPTFTDLRYDAGNQLGNPDLRPETAWLFSVGGAYQWQDAGKSLDITADAYYRRGTNIIDWVYVPTDTRRPYHAMNRQRVNGAGTEITAAYQHNEWLRRCQISYAYAWLDLDLHEAQSRYLDYLSHKLVVSLEHGIYISHDALYGIIAAAWQLRYQQREGDFTNAEGQVRAYKPVWLLDGEIFWKNERAKVSLDCTNITNRRYYDNAALLMPGTWARIVVQLKLL